MAAAASTTLRELGRRARACQSQAAPDQKQREAAVARPHADACHLGEEIAAPDARAVGHGPVAADHHGGDVDGAAAQDLPHAVGDGIGEGDLAGHDAGGLLGVDVLEVDVAHTVEVGERDGDGVGTGGGQVAGVDAQADARAVEDLLLTCLPTAGGHLPHI